MKMKNILILVALLVSVSLNSVNAKESFFNIKKGELSTPCIHVSDDLGYYDATFKQRGSSSNFELTSATFSEDCLPESIEPLEIGDACELTEDISNLVDFTGVDCESEGIVCTAIQAIDGTVNEDGECELPEVEPTEVEVEVEVEVEPTV